MRVHIAQHPAAAVEIHDHRERAGAALGPDDANGDVAFRASGDRAVFDLRREFQDVTPLGGTQDAAGVFDRQLVDLRAALGGKLIQECLRVWFHDGVSGRRCLRCVLHRLVSLL